MKPDMERLSRAAAGRAAAPVRLVHLGLGGFFRAHQAWYTDRAPDAGEWGIAAFSGRSAALAEALDAQGGLYTLVTRAGDGDRYDVIASVVRAHAAADEEAWRAYLAAPDVRAVTLTVTEAAYAWDDADVEALRAGAPPRSVPARLLAGLAARRRADAGPLTLVPCDNLPGNGAVLARLLGELAERVDGGLAAWVADSVATATTMVDRITPRITPDDLRTVERATGAEDHAPVVTEPFSEWVIAGEFPGGRPRWEAAGATLTTDAAPFERRKLWLLNGGHSLLAYAGSLRGHATVAEAMADATCRAWLEDWWDAAAAHLDLDAGEYRAALLERFANPRIQHRLAQIAADGSQKLPVRVLPVLRAERAAGRLPDAATRILGAWVCHLGGQGVPVDDAGAPPAGDARAVLAALDPALAEDDAVVGAVAAHAEELGRQ